MRLLDSRRLAGPNLQQRRAGALVEVEFEPGEDPERALAAWTGEVAALSAALAVACEEPRVRRFRGGAALSFAAPLDVLLAATDLNDLAVARASDTAAGRPLPELEPQLEPLREKLKAQRRPELLALEEQCLLRDLPLLWDDETLSIGIGRRSWSWPLSALPRLSDVPWETLGRIPVALITGTNGKTTSARLLAHVALAAGVRVGLAATDYASVGGVVLDRGDYTGPAAARLILRNPEVELAVLETARGGILRRGLALDRADAALITNVGDDHLGEYGIHTVEELARAKAVIGGVVRPGGRVVLSADDPVLVKLWREQPELFSAPIVWTTLGPAGALQAGGALQAAKASQPGASLVAAHLRAGGEAWALVTGALRRYGPDLPPEGEELLRAAELPIAFGGAATYNVANALGVCALATALGLPRAALLQGLRSFRPGAADNPGRANLYDVGGVHVLVDFGHNAHAVHQVGGLVAALRARHPGGALAVISGCAGDRSDQNLADLAAEIASMIPARVLLRDLPDYLRGRAPGEVPALLRRDLVALGLPPAAVELAADERSALRAALEKALPGDLVLLLVHLDEEEIQAELEARGANPG